MFSYPSALVARMPVWPFSKVYELSEKHLELALDDPFFKEALWLASPVLYDEAVKWRSKTLNPKESQKVVYSLAKYFQRLCTRYTPFGLFAGCTVMPISDLGLDKSQSEIEFEIRRTTRLDANFVIQLILGLENNPAIRKTLKFKSNSSLYAVNDKYRYVSYRYVNGKKKFDIVEIEKNDVLGFILTKCAKTYSGYHSLIEIIIGEGYDQSVAEEFLNELIESQVLTSILEATTLSDNLMSDLIPKMEALQVPDFFPFIQRLKQLQDELDHLDRNKINDISKYQLIAASINELNIPFDISKLFQIDAYLDLTTDNVFAKTDIDKLEDAMNAILPFIKPGQNNGSSIFINKFFERYEEEEVPLALVLDTDAGIGYPINKINSAETPLIDDFHVSNNRNQNSITLDNLDLVLFELISHATQNGSYTVDLTQYAVINASTQNDSRLFQPSLNVLFNRARVDDKDCLLFTAASANSAIDFLGRFAHTCEKIKDLVFEVAEHERESEPGYIFADIVHLPETSRIANITLRPSVHNYQISYLANDGGDKEVIDLSDIMVSVRENQIFLRSQKLNKFIIPRLYNAHNYAYSKMPIYHFLCDVQNQSTVKYLSFDWGNAGKLFKFHPRVVYKDVVVKPASWSFSYRDVQGILEAYKKEKIDVTIEKVKAWRAQFKIPDEVVLSEGDNELYVNFNNELSTAVFFNEIKKDSAFTLIEFLCGDIQNNKHVVQYALPLLRIQKGLEPKMRPEENFAERKFLPGDDILYLKIYGGNKMLENLLIAEIRETLNDFVESKAIEKWFFIRYSDPEFHLRIRLFLNKDGSQKDVTKTLSNLVNKYVKENTLWKLTIDTYSREVERYGSHFISECEDLFYWDSISCVDFLNVVNVEEGKEAFRWKFALLSIDRFLEDCGLDITGKYDVMKPIRDSFFKEFGGTKQLMDMLGKKFRSGRRDFDELFFSDKKNFSGVLQCMHGILDKRSVASRATINKLKSKDPVQFRKILGSCIHMTLNRLFLSDPRKHELVIYDLLERNYKSMMARKQHVKETIDE